MASINLPYMTVPGTLAKILDKIKEAGTPENFSGDFLSTKLGFKGGNYRTFISWAKKIGFLNGDGTPTQLYKKFRNPTTSKTSLAEGLRKGYAELYERNEYCHTLNKPDLKGLVMEATGQAHDSKVVEFIVNTFFNAKSLADFENTSNDSLEEPKVDKPENNNPNESHTKKIHLGLNYTINLVLPKTDEPSVYDAIFKSLKENLLKG